METRRQFETQKHQYHAKSNSHETQKTHVQTEEEQMDVCYKNTDNKEDILKCCWYHKTNSHNTSRCRLLWSLSGKEVWKLAKEFGRCTVCGLKEHNPCPH